MLFYFLEKQMEKNQKRLNDELDRSKCSKIYANLFLFFFFTEGRNFRRENADARRMRDRSPQGAGRRRGSGRRVRKKNSVDSRAASRKSSLTGGDGTERYQHREWRVIALPWLPSTRHARPSPHPRHRLHSSEGSIYAATLPQSSQSSHSIQRPT